jgi:hypothetical protein
LGVTYDGVRERAGAALNLVPVPRRPFDVRDVDRPLRRCAAHWRLSEIAAAPASEAEVAEKLGLRDLYLT